MDERAKDCNENSLAGTGPLSCASFVCELMKDTFDNNFFKLDLL
jgi:hypothetical protein